MAARPPIERCRRPRWIGNERHHVHNPELLMAEAYDEGVVSEVIRPAAVVPEESARAVLVELALRDVQNGGGWQAEPSLWGRYGRPGGGYGAPRGGGLIGGGQGGFGAP